MSEERSSVALIAHVAVQKLNYKDYCESPYSALVDHVRTRGLPVRIRHGRHLGRRAKDPGAVALEPDHARNCDRLGSLRYCSRISARWLPYRSSRTPQNLGADRRSVLHRRTM